MAFNQGIDFRSTAGFVTDPANTDVETATTANYPRTSAQGNSVGWEDALSGVRNRTSTVDARLAGIAFTANGTPTRYRIDLPSAGWYKVTLAMGDNTTAQSQAATIFDDTTVVSHVIGQNVATASGNFFDACGEEWSTAANWVSGQQTFIAHFSSTIFRVKIGEGAASGNSTIAHVRVEDATATTPGLSMGVAFRGTGLFVTDAAGVSSEVNNFADYPHITSQNFTVGWEQAPSSASNRSNAVDARLAGVHAVSAGTQSNFRVDLPAAHSYVLSAAIGDATVPQGTGVNPAQTVEVFDDASSLGTFVSGGFNAAGEFYDASGVKRTSAADWVTNQVAVTKSFSTTILRLKCGIAAGGVNATTLAYFAIVQATVTDAQSARARISKDITKTQTAKARISKTLTKNQTATARIRGNASKAQTSIARISKTLTKTQTARARISRTLTKIQTSIANISTTASLTKTQTATARIGTGSVTLTTSGIYLFAAGDVNYWPTVTAIGEFNFQGDNPSIGFVQIPSGVFVFRADSPSAAGPIQPANSGQFVFAGDPLLIAGIVQTLSGVLKLSADPPIFYPLSPTSGAYALSSDGATLSPTVGVSGRFLLNSDQPNIYPTPIPSSGKLIFKSDLPEFASASIILRASGILLLKSDSPTVIPLTEPPPPPPPPPPGGINLHVSVMV